VTTKIMPPNRINNTWLGELIKETEAAIQRLPVKGKEGH
jgi:hypothetical protein